MWKALLAATTKDRWHNWPRRTSLDHDQFRAYSRVKWKKAAHLVIRKWPVAISDHKRLMKKVSNYSSLIKSNKMLVLETMMLTWKWSMMLIKSINSSLWRLQQEEQTQLLYFNGQKVQSRTSQMNLSCKCKMRTKMKKKKVEEVEPCFEKENR